MTTPTGGDDDIDGDQEEKVKEAYIDVSRVSKLFAGARIFGFLLGT